MRCIHKVTKLHETPYNKCKLSTMLNRFCRNSKFSLMRINDRRYKKEMELDKAKSRGGNSN